MTTSHEQTLVVSTRYKETRKMCYYEAYSSEDSDYSDDNDYNDDSDDNDMPSHERSKINLQNCAHSSTAPAQRDDDKVTIPDE